MKNESPLQISEMSQQIRNEARLEKLERLEGKQNPIAFVVFENLLG